MTGENGIPSQSRVFHRKLGFTPLDIERAEGVYLYERGTGRKIMDACGGAAVVSVGHCVPEILSYVSSVAFGNQPAEELALLLCEASGMSRAIFLTGGSEAMESAIKLCRQYHIENGQPGRINFIGREKSYHGNTVSTLSLGRHERRRAHYLPLFGETYHAVSPCYAYRHKNEGETDVSYVQRLASELDAKFQAIGADSVAAFVLEPVVGATTGCVPFAPGYLRAMRDVCRRHGALLVFDEIMCGFGRTGKFNAWEWDDCQPDIQVLGKGLCGGYTPLSAVLMNQRVVDVFKAGSGAFVNGHTYQSSVIGCRAGLECYKYITKHNLIEQCHQRGLLMSRLLVEKVLPHRNVGDVRGMGLFWGIEFVLDKQTKNPYGAEFPAADLVTQECMQRGIMVYPGMKGAADGFLGDHVMLCPPYIISEEEVHQIVDILLESINAVLG